MKYICFFLITSFLLSLSAGCNNQSAQVADNLSVKQLNLSEYSAEKPSMKINLLFIHHSCGATLLADPGEKAGEYCLFETHPNGGGLRTLLEENGYVVHQATYKSQVGDRTDIGDWNGKFRDNMDRILKTDRQDIEFSNSTVNNIVVFKSCYPNNMFVGRGTPPGDPDSHVLTVENAKAAYNALLRYFSKQPQTLFVAITAPPIVKPRMHPLKEWGFGLLGKGPRQMGGLAREFNNWLKDSGSGWLSQYDQKNVVVFDYYDILTDFGVSNWCQYPTREGRNSHPSADGNQKAAKQFVEFLNRSVRYAGLI